MNRMEHNPCCATSTPHHHLWCATPANHNLWCPRPAPTSPHDGVGMVAVPPEWNLPSCEPFPMLLALFPFTVLALHIWLPPDDLP